MTYVDLAQAPTAGPSGAAGIEAQIIIASRLSIDHFTSNSALSKSSVFGSITITMSFLRIVRPSLLRPLSRSPAQRMAFVNQHRYASQDYGSPNGDMVKESPKDRGKNPSEDKEHPGPPPPASAQKGNKASKQQSGRSSSAQQSGGSTKGTQGAQPKILQDERPADSDVPEDVRRHNEEMDRRAEKAHEKASDATVEKDKVGKQFWAGEWCIKTGHTLGSLVLIHLQVAVVQTEIPRKGKG